MRFLFIFILIAGVVWTVLPGSEDSGAAARAAQRERNRGLRIAGFAVIATGSVIVLAWREGRLRPHAPPVDREEQPIEPRQPSLVVWRDRYPVRGKRRVIDLKPGPSPHPVRRAKRWRPRRRNRNRHHHETPTRP